MTAKEVIDWGVHVFLEHEGEQSDFQHKYFSEEQAREYFDFIKNQNFTKRARLVKSVVIDELIEEWSNEQDD